jgi:hypothetical protein
MYWTARRYIPDDGTVRNHGCEIPSPHIVTINLSQIRRLCQSLYAVIGTSVKTPAHLQIIRNGMVYKLNSIIINYLTNPIELSPSCKAALSALTQAFPNIKTYYHVHKRRALVLILSQINPVHATKSLLYLL